MRLTRAACALVLVASGAPWAGLAAEGVSVVGRVTGRQGEPKQFASVALTGPGRHAAVTDAGGEFKIPDVQPGRYTVRVRQGDKVEAFARDLGGSPIELVVKW